MFWRSLCVAVSSSESILLPKCLLFRIEDRCGMSTSSVCIPLSNEDLFVNVGNKKRNENFQEKWQFITEHHIRRTYLIWSFLSYSLLRSIHAASSNSKTWTLFIMVSKSFLFSVKIILLSLTIAWKYWNLNNNKKKISNYISTRIYCILKYLSSPTSPGTLASSLCTALNFSLILVNS